MPQFSYQYVYDLMDAHNNLSKEAVWRECAEHYIETDPAATKECFIGASIDSRTIEKNQIFFPFKGANINGYDFVNQAMCIANSFVITDHLISQLSIEKQIVVKSTHKALQLLGMSMRKKIQGKMVAYTGSAGKTTTKMMLKHILTTLKKHVFASMQSYNTVQYGVPLSLINCPSDVFACILEAGMSEAGTLDKISALVDPDIAVITSIQRAHIGNFNSLEEIAYEKVQLVNHAKELVILPMCAYTRQMYDYAKQFGLKIYCFGDQKDENNSENSGDDTQTIENNNSIKLNAALLDMKWNGKQNVCKVRVLDQELTITIPHPSRDFVMSAMANLLVCSHLGLDLEACVKTLSTFVPFVGRGEIKKITVLAKPMKIFDESYNANFDAMVAALKTFKALEGEHPVLILGQMNDLGAFSQQLHLDLAEHIKEYKNIILLGTEMQPLVKKLKEDNVERKVFFANTLLDIFSYLHQELPYYPTETTFFIKGSRHTVNLDKVVEFLANYDKRL